MLMEQFPERLSRLRADYQALINRPNQAIERGNGIYQRYRYPVLTASHVPLEWRYDLNPSSNPYLMERLMVNAVFNAGAIKWQGRYLLVARVEGADRKSFFGIAESDNGIDGFQFWKRPLSLPPTRQPEVNVYDMRLTAHEDGWIYGLFCSERQHPQAAAGDTSSALAMAGIVRTKDFNSWERLPELKTPSAQQRNVVLHPRFVKGRYLLYTRPQDGFIDTGRGGGICTALVDSMEKAEALDEKLLDPRVYHTIKEAKNGAGAPPLETPAGWLHLAHGVRQTAAGLRYVIYAFLCDPADPSQVIARPSGYLLAPLAEERVGDVSNVVFVNGLIADDDGRVLIYYASSDTRLHVAESTIDRLVEYCLKTPEDGLSSAASVATRLALIDQNESYLANQSTNQ